MGEKLKKASGISTAVYDLLLAAPADAADAMDTDDKGSTKTKPALSELVIRLQDAHSGGLISTAAYTQLLRHNGKDGDEAALEEEPTFEVLENPSRVLRNQERFVTLLPASRYVPIARGRTSGIIMLKDLQPDETEELLPESVLAVPSGTAADEEEPNPPAPFEFHG